MLVQEDLCLMRRGPGGWRLAAASVSFPSSWSLRDKFGRTLDALHEPVPGYAGTMAVRMARVFDNLRVGIPVTRMNWSLYGDAHLHHPDTHGPLLEGRDEADGIDGLFMAGRTPDADEDARKRRSAVHHPHPCRPAVHAA